MAGLGASELLIADCRYAIRGDRVPRFKFRMAEKKLRLTFGLPR